MAEVAAPQASSSHEHASAQYTAHQGQFQIENQFEQAQQAPQVPEADYGPEEPIEARRYGDAPRNSNNKIYCIRPECRGVTFDRRCEWTKHMDKHDRPYRCDRPGCEKLRGFTYSGGLLRHQREVHRDHGGPKETLKCPIPYCKRNNGLGFTRKENLNEHLRRVHRHVQPPAPGSDDENNPPVDPLMDAQNRNEAAEAAEAAQHAAADGLAQAAPYEPAVEPAAAAAVQVPVSVTDEPPPKRRRRATVQQTPRSENNLQIAALQQQIEELKRQNEEKDARISRLEQMQMMALTGQQNGVAYQPQVPQAQMQVAKRDATGAPASERIEGIEEVGMGEQMLREKAEAAVREDMKLPAEAAA